MFRAFALLPKLPSISSFIAGKSALHATSAAAATTTFSINHGISATSLARSFADQKTFEELSNELSPGRKKLMGLLNEYRNKHFTQSIPSRFVKEMINALDSNHDNVVTMEEYQTLLKNIGADDKMTSDELKECFDELGVEGVIPVQTLIDNWTPLFRAPSK